MRLVRARASDMKQSMPRMSTRPATGTWATAERVAAKTMKPLPVMPAAPLEVSSNTPSRVSWLVRLRGVLVACGHRKVDRCAVKVEGIPGGDHQPYGRFLGAKVLQLGYHAGQHRFRGLSAEAKERLARKVRVRGGFASRSCTSHRQNAGPGGRAVGPEVLEILHQNEGAHGAQSAGFEGSHVPALGIGPIAAMLQKRSAHLLEQGSQAGLLRGAAFFTGGFRQWPR